MKYCPVCYAEFPDDHIACPKDNVALRGSGGWRPGDTIRKYRIVEKIGEGGMGSVYKAQHITFEEWRALKVMHASLASDPKFVRRFLREAKTARRLRHPNSCAVEDIDQADDGSLFIAMEYIEGPPLSAVIKGGGPMPPPRAFAIARGVASALQTAHALGIIHRDIKPANILMARDGNGNDLPKLVDFGIVVLQDASATTLTSQLMLTPTYAAPEQFQMASDQIDGRADLYALGFVLFEMLTGRLPFSAPNPTAWMMAKLMQAMPMPSSFVPQLALTPQIDEIYARLTATDREQRYRDAGELIAAIDASGVLPAGFAFPEYTSPFPVAAASNPATLTPMPTGPIPAPPTVHPAAAQPAPALTQSPAYTQTPAHTQTPAAPPKQGQPALTRALWVAGPAALLLAVVAIYLSFSREPAAVATQQPAATSAPPPQPAQPPPSAPASTTPPPETSTAQPKPAPVEPRRPAQQAAAEPPAATPQRTPVSAGTPISAGDQGGRIIRRTPAVYPEDARRAGIQGIVQFTALVGTDGTVKSLTLVEGHPLLVPAAREAFKSWLFEPTYVDGQPVEFTSHLSMTFRLD